MKSKRIGYAMGAVLALLLGVALVGGLGGTPKQVRAQSAPEARTALNGLSDAFAKAVEVTSPSVVFIEVEKEMKRSEMGGMPDPHGDIFERFFGPFGMPGPGMPGPRGPRMPRGPQQPRNDQGNDYEGDQFMPYGQGTGFVISQDGYIVTNAHVVGDADKVKVKLADGREFEAKIIGSDKQTEIAVIKVEATGLPPLKLGDSDKLRVGEWVMAIGNPFGLSHTVTAGIISACGRGSTGITQYSDLIQTDAAINPGNSGGPLLNLDGEVIGVNTALYSRSGGYMGISFAVPVNIVKYVQEQLINHGSVSRGYLGLILQDNTPDLAKGMQVEYTKGVLVPEVLADGPAGQAGVQPEDIIVELNGQPVEESASFKSRVGSTAPGSEVNLGILRAGKRIDLKVKLGELPKEREVGGGMIEKKTPEGSKIKLGFTVQNLTEEIAGQLGFENQKGVVVTEVLPGSPADHAGLVPELLIQEANRKPITNANDFESVIKDAKPGDALLLKVRDGEFSRYISLKIDEEKK